LNLLDQLITTFSPRERIEREFEDWAETTECDVEGRKNFYEIKIGGISW
jgi:hypothetical protein